MTTPPSPAPTPKKQFFSALLWAVVSAAVAIVVFLKAANPDTKNRNFYILAGVVAAIATIANGYFAWLAYKKSQSPPTA